MNVLRLIIIFVLFLCFSNGYSVFPLSSNGFDFVSEISVINNFDIWRLISKEMASSQVEIASSSPFGCVVLRDHSHSRDRCSFQKNLKELVSSCCIASDNSHVDDSWLPEQKVVKKSKNDDESWLPEKKVVKKSKIHDRWSKAREMVFNDGDKKTEDMFLTTSFTRELSPAQSDESSSIEIRNSGGVSSLVRKWRHFEADSKNSNAGNGSPISTMSNPGSTFNENPSFIDANDSVDGKSVVSEELFFDWESERTTGSGSSSVRGRDIDAAEKERIRVADIVKKLTTSDGNDREPLVAIEPLARIKTAIDQQQVHGDHQQPRIFPQVIGSPRLIRGRQAYSNFLLQMERDKNMELQGLLERKPVSKFSHRGRIQALLRVRFLRRELEAKCHRRAMSKTLDSNRFTIKHLRERFSAAIERGLVAESPNKESIKDNAPNVENSSTSGSGCGSSTQTRDMINKIPRAKNPSPPKQVTEEICESTSRPCKVEKEDSMGDLKSSSSAPDLTQLKETSSTSMPKNTDQLQSNLETNHQETRKTILEQRSEGSQEHAVIITKETLNLEEKCVANAQKQEQELTVGSEHEWVKEISQAQSQVQSIWEDDDESTRELLANCQDWISDFSQPRSEWDEQESNYGQQYETNTDWISDIARPRSDWEGLRQARYQEMLDPYSDKGEIRQLLERRSVSSFLSSGLRDRIDQLMISRTEGQAYPLDIQVKEQEQEQEQKQEQGQEDEQEGSVKVRELTEEEEEEEEEAMEVEGECEEEEINIDDEQLPMDEEEGEEEIHIDDDHIASSMQLNSPFSQSWSRNDDQEVNDDFDQFASPSLQQSTPSSTYSRINQQSPSIEMEFIYDLRGHMQQLHQEISDLRKSIKSCVSMQVKLQRSIKQEVATAVSQSVRRQGKESVNTKKRGCLVCKKMKVDSLLYRCGHMCTCFKCAQELQWGSGKCPICQSSILDVVRTHDR